jgi:hypothetical protein
LAADCLLAVRYPAQAWPRGLRFHPISMRFCRLFLRKQEISVY